MTNGFSAASVAGTIVPIAGMGIGLAMLAGTSKAVMNKMYGDSWKPKNYNRPRRKTSLQKRKRKLNYKSVRGKPVSRYKLNVPKYW